MACYLSLLKMKTGTFSLIYFDIHCLESVAISKIDSDSVCKALLRIFSRIGFPESDNVPQFSSSLTDQVAKTLGIKQKLCLMYHPAGLCEKLNSLLKTLLGKITNDHPEDWDLYLQPVLFALREVTHENTSFSHFELLLECQPRVVLSLYQDLITQKENSEYIKDTY